MLPDKLAFVDIETTGASASRGRIIEIGIVRVENNKITKTYQTLLNPDTYLPQQIEMLTGITMKDLEGQPRFRDVADDILEILDGCVFVAHNVRFDYSFLKHEFIRENISFTSKHFCTVKLSRFLYPHATHHNLDAIIQRFGFIVEQRHRAFTDAEVLWKFYQLIQKQFPEEKLLAGVNHALRRPSVPIKLETDVLDTLPEQPGVYIFYAEGGMPLYVGKSINIRDRVLSHFSGDIHSPKEMNIAQQVERIETITTAGELGALFLESQTIKKLLPLYNRMLRVKRELVALTKVIDKDGYESVKMETIQSIDAQKLDTFIGFFKSRKEAKTFLAHIAEEFGLCEKLLGLEKTSTSCFGYRLDRCKGACIGKEKPLFYNLRFTTACFKTKIKPWPFPGPILIHESNEIAGITESYIIDKWCYLGSVSVNNELNELSSRFASPTAEYAFDLDMYKILLRYLKNPANSDKIHVINKNEYERLNQYKTIV